MLHFSACWKAPAAWTTRSTPFNTFSSELTSLMSTWAQTWTATKFCNPTRASPFFLFRLVKRIRSWEQSLESMAVVDSPTQIVLPRTKTLELWIFSGNAGSLVAVAIAVTLKFKFRGNEVGAVEFGEIVAVVFFVGRWIYLCCVVGDGRNWVKQGEWLNSCMKSDGAAELMWVTKSVNCWVWSLFSVSVHVVGWSEWVAVSKSANDDEEHDHRRRSTVETKQWARFRNEGDGGGAAVVAKLVQTEQSNGSGELHRWSSDSIKVFMVEGKMRESRRTLYHTIKIHFNILKEFEYTAIITTPTT